jgi:hypothetical protein
MAMFPKLDAYNFLAMIPAGAVFLVGWYIIFGGHGPFSAYVPASTNVQNISETLNGLGSLVLIAFVLGLLMHAIARFLERLWWYPFGGWPSVRLLRQIWEEDSDGKWPNRKSAFVRRFHSDQLTELSPDLRNRLTKALSKWEIISNAPPADDLKDGKTLFVIQRQMFALVNNHKRGKRIGVFERNYGSYSGLLVTFAALFFSALYQHYFSASYQHNWFLMGVFLLASVVCAFGTWASGEDCAGELVLQFAYLEPCKPDKGASADTEIAVTIER